jgi:hypothetical protein
MLMIDGVHTSRRHEGRDGPFIKLIYRLKIPVEPG